jgi:hypothetical protein
VDIDRFRLIFAWVVLVIWASSILVAVFDRSYSPEPTVHLLMMVVAGALFGPSFVRRRDDR